MKPFCYHPFDLRQLVSFAEIARAGSFRQAAKTLHIAQPALSRQIKQLEAALGICLFDRAPRRLHLTIEGRELASRLPAFFSQIEHLTDAVKGANAGGTSHLRIGDGGVLTTEVIAPALRRLRQEWPNLRLSSVQNTSEGFFQDLLQNRIDCAFPALQSKGNELISHELCRLEIGHFGQNDGAPLHWRYNLSSLDPANPDARMLSCLPQKSFIATSEMFYFGLPGVGQGFQYGNEAKDCGN